MLETKIIKKNKSDISVFIYNFNKVEYMKIETLATKPELKAKIAIKNRIKSK